MTIGCGTPVAAKASTEFAMRSTARPSRRIANKTPLASSRPTTPTQKPVGSPKMRGTRSPRTSATSQLPVGRRAYTDTGSFDSAQLNARCSRPNRRARISATTDDTSVLPRRCRTTFSISRTCARSAEAGGPSGVTRNLSPGQEIAPSTSFRCGSSRRGQRRTTGRYLVGHQTCVVACTPPARFNERRRQREHLDQYGDQRYPEKNAPQSSSRKFHETSSTGKARI